ncbi:class I SAM-dependent methyltransferase [Achromobacter mucicolens]|uniref:class I SAM-dependent methyltransferase n=1 Tax=Achromobacter mucicolens TaxID=1389922 RepID=UPI00244D3E0E|nr:class I SAM-dependent methyltransferase [Achromobacter mucicolens]MDH0089856.1 class I SAM-dependent methyltransferase [Achromobacter mucicolens]
MYVDTPLSSWSIEALPFFYRCQKTPSNQDYGLPDQLPFTLEFDAKLGLARQGKNVDVERALELCYQQGSEISGMMEDNGIGQHYAADFLAYIEKNELALSGRRVLEIGCGTGYLLSLLQARGADVVGIEPGGQGGESGNRYGVRVIKGFFPTTAITDKFDVIIAYGVLEHIIDPVQFLKDVANSLRPGGTAYIAVPNCAPYLESGDISCLLHEHWSYFNQGSLRRVCVAAGMEVSIEPSGFGGSIYCRATLGAVAEADFRLETESAASEFHGFQAKARQTSARMSAFIQGAGDAGIYVPGRMINLLAITPGAASGNLRFFDDNASMKGLYYPGFDFPIEDFSALKKAPPARLLIATSSFHAQVSERISAAGVDIPLTTWADFFSGLDVAELNGSDGC